MPYCDKCRLRRARHVLARGGAYNTHLCQECFQAEHPRPERPGHAGGVHRHRPDLPDGVNALAFTPDGRTLASAGNDRSIRLSDPETEYELLSLRGHAHKINALTFTCDGRTLASASHDGIVRLWPGPHAE
jgi:hypothetical protein